MGNIELIDSGVLVAKPHCQSGRCLERFEVLQVSVFASTLHATLALTSCPLVRNFTDFTNC